MSTAAPLTPSSTQHNQVVGAQVYTQGTLDASMKRKSTAAVPNPKKRKLALADGSELSLHSSFKLVPYSCYIMTQKLTKAFFAHRCIGELDLNGSIPVTPEVLAAMRLRIFQVLFFISYGA